MHQSTATWHLEGRSIQVSHLEKRSWPEAGITKGDLLRYYRSMAPVLLPYLQDRPVTLRFFPDGVQGFSTSRLTPPEHAPAWLRSVSYHPKTAAHVIPLPLIDDAAGLLWLANQECVEFHAWGARLPHLTQPDQAIFDLDPGSEATFAEVLQAALWIQGVRGYAKTSGGRGLHISLPLAPGQTFAGVRAWVKALAQQLASASPELIALAHGPTHRGRQVTIDDAQNSIGRNTAAPYTLRAHPDTPVSAPLGWEEIEAGDFSPRDLTIQSVPDRVRRLGDLFAPVRQAGQHLPPMARSSMHLEGDGPVSHDPTRAAGESRKDNMP